MRTRLLIAGPLAMIASLFLAASAMAGVRLTVTTTADNSAGPSNDDGQCTLREAITASNAGDGLNHDCPSSGTPSENQIGFAAALGAHPVINLTAFGDLQFGTNDVTVTGPATVNGFTGFRVITSNGINLTLNSLTISNGNENNNANNQGLGGGIRQINGRLFLNGSTVSGNTTTRDIAGNPDVEGGGIYSSGPVTLTDSVVTNNQAIANTTGGSTASAIALGGGVEVSGDDVTMDNSVASGNKVIASGNGSGNVEADGAGVRSDGEISIEHSTISGNLASATATGSGQPVVQGGGLLFHGTLPIDIELSTIVNNLMKAPTSTTAGLQVGGGINDSSTDTADYVSDTIAGNGLDAASQTTGTISGLNFLSHGATENFSNAIIANPVGSPGTNCFGGPFADNSTPNVEFPGDMTTPCFDATHMNIMHADPQLGALGNHGGGTPTMVPATTSPVIDQGTASDQNDLTKDQRGLTRPVAFSSLIKPFDGSDIGAVEVQKACASQTKPTDTCPSGGGQSPPPPATPMTTTPTPTPTTKKKCKKKGKKASAAKKKCKKKKHKK